eukprot:1813733-Prorocentrum_lima.AAC.1
MAQDATPLPGIGRFYIIANWCVCSIGLQFRLLHQPWRNSTLALRRSLWCLPASGDGDFSH